MIKGLLASILILIGIGVVVLIFALAFYILNEAGVIARLKLLRCKLFFKKSIFFETSLNIRELRTLLSSLDDMGISYFCFIPESGEGITNYLGSGREPHVSNKLKMVSIHFKSESDYLQTKLTHERVFKMNHREGWGI